MADESTVAATFCATPMVPLDTVSVTKTAAEAAGAAPRAPTSATTTAKRSARSLMPSTISCVPRFEDLLVLGPLVGAGIRDRMLRDTAAQLVDGLVPVLLHPGTEVAKDLPGPLRTLT